MRSHDKVRVLFAENKVRFVRAEQLWFIIYSAVGLLLRFVSELVIAVRFHCRVSSVIVGLIL